MGQAAGSNYIRATIGFLITGVGLPMLGVVASGISRSENLYDMAKPVSSAYAVFYLFVIFDNRPIVCNTTYCNSSI